MVSLKSVAVHVDTPAQISPSKFFGDVEAWLDTNKIEPVNFRITGGWAAGFDICFGTTDRELADRLDAVAREYEAIADRLDRLADRPSE